LTQWTNGLRNIFIVLLAAPRLSREQYLSFDDLKCHTVRFDILGLLLENKAV